MMKNDQKGVGIQSVALFPTVHWRELRTTKNRHSERMARSEFPTKYAEFHVLHVHSSGLI